MKQSHVRLKKIVANEQLCLMTAKNLGIDVRKVLLLLQMVMMKQYSLQQNDMIESLWKTTKD